MDGLSLQLFPSALHVKLKARLCFLDYIKGSKNPFDFISLINRINQSDSMYIPTSVFIIHVSFYLVRDFI